MCIRFSQPTLISFLQNSSLYCYSFPYIDMYSVADLLIMLKRKRNRETNNFMYRYLCVAIVSVLTKQRRIVCYEVGRIDISSVTVRAFSSLALAMSVRLLSY